MVSWLPERGAAGGGKVTVVTVVGGGIVTLRRADVTPALTSAEEMLLANAVGLDSPATTAEG